MLRSAAFQKFLSKFGYVLAGDGLHASGQKRALQAVHEQLTLDVLRTRKIDCVLDVGANEGQYAARLRARGFGGRVISFEPAAETFRKLQAKAAADPQWKAMKLALGARIERRPLNVMRKSTFNSFAAPEIAGAPQFAGRNQVDHMEEVEVATLDSLLPRLRTEHGCSHFFLKLDTQGFDMQVLDGACESLKHVQAVQIEASFLPIYANMPPATDSMQRLEGLGFALVSFLPVSRHEQTQAIIEADCLYAR